LAAVRIAHVVKTLCKLLIPGGAAIPGCIQPALKPEKRHTAACIELRRRKDPDASEYDDYARCKCADRAVGMLGGRFIRKSLKTANYETAVETIRQWEGNRQQEPSDRGPVTVQNAVKNYLEDAKARNLGESTLTKLETIFKRQFLSFCGVKGFQFITQVADVNVMREFRSTWKDAPLSRSKKQDRAVGFLFFCERTGWIHRNPVTTRALGRIKVVQKPTDYFTPAEFDSDAVGNRARSAPGRQFMHRWPTFSGAL